MGADRAPARHLDRRRRLEGGEPNLGRRLGRNRRAQRRAAGFAWLCATRPDQPFALPVYIALGAFSCLFVTKDTPLHARVCNAGEMWLHAVLFVLHPLVFVASGFIWWFGLAPGLLAGQLVVMLVYASYQFFYWRWWWHRRQSTPTP